MFVNHIFLVTRCDYAKHWAISKSNLAIYHRRQVYNSCVLPAMAYGAETWLHRPKWK